MLKGVNTRGGVKWATVLIPLAKLLSYCPLAEYSDCLHRCYFSTAVQVKQVWLSHFSQRLYCHGKRFASGMFNREEEALEIVLLATSHWWACSIRPGFPYRPLRKTKSDWNKLRGKWEWSDMQKNMVYGLCSLGIGKIGWRCQWWTSVILENSLKRSGITLSLCLQGLNL